MSVTVIWVELGTGPYSHRDVAVALSVVNERLISRMTDDAGQNWSGWEVEAEKVRGFAADYVPSQHRIRIVTWYDFLTDEHLGIYYFTETGGKFERQTDVDEQ